MTKRIRVGITGVEGFIGSHLRARLSLREQIELVDYDRAFFEDASDRLVDFIRACDVLVHLAGMNRGDPEEVYRVNVALMRSLTCGLSRVEAPPRVLFASSTHEGRDDAYGRSKRDARQMLHAWARGAGAHATTLIIPNVFGDRGRPFYNSVVATFCHQIARGETPKVHEDAELSLIFINELTEVVEQHILEPLVDGERREVSPSCTARVSEILSWLRQFHHSYTVDRVLPRLGTRFEHHLYTTFVTYLEAESRAQSLPVRTDERGSLCEVVKWERGGQVFFSTTKPGFVRGNHYHTRKIEKFCVVRGDALIRMRHIDEEVVLEYRVSGDAPVSIEMPIFHTHSIENVGQGELLTLFWANEVFDPEDPDTFYEQV